MIIFVHMLPEELIYKASSELAKKLKPTFIKSIKESSGEMLDLSDEQLDKSILNTGQSITPKYTPNYAKKKGFNSPDLKVTGDYRKSKYVDVTDKGLFFSATDYKTPFLESRYGKDINGLTKENTNKIVPKWLAPVDKVINETNKSL